MVYRSSTEGGYGGDASVFHVDASHADRIDIADAELLFRGHFARSGPDLVLTGQDGHRHIVPGYFATEKHPDLIAPNGAHLSGDTVGLLAGSPTPGQYAQAGTALPPEAIGKVQKVVGQVTLVHSGVSGPLHVGDAVYKTDVVETGPNSSCGIAFPDGTALDLVAGTRMALNDFSFDANNAGSNNALFTLVEGTFAFVAGQVAHTGNGMRITTPVATMGIRGTVGLFRSEPTVINANLGHVWSVFLHEDLDGSHHLGRIALIDQDPTSPTYGQVFYLLDSSDYIAYLEPRGAGLAPQVRLEPITNSKIFDDRHFYNDLSQIINSYINGNVNPQSNPGTPGSSTPPDLLKIQFQLFQEGSGPPTTNNIQYNGGQNSGNPPQPPGTLGIPVQPGQIPTPRTTTPSGPPQTIFIWNGVGPWPTALPNWNQGAAPNSPIDQVIVQSGTATYDLSDTTISFLTVDAGATLDIAGGILNTGGLIDNGTIIVDGDPPALVIDGPATIGSTGKIEVTGTGSEVDFNGSAVPGSIVDNQGLVAARQGGIVDFIEEGLTNEAHGRIVASGKGAQVNFDGSSSDPLDNFGTIAARHHGTISFDDVPVVNETSGKIKSIGRGSTIDFKDGAELFNDGLVVAADHGRIDFDGGIVVNGTTTDGENGIPGEIEAVGCGSTISFSDGAEFFNEGLAVAEERGAILFDGATVENQEQAKIEAERGGEVVFDRSQIDNERSGSIAADGRRSVVDFDHSGLSNSGRVEADDSGTVLFDFSQVDNGRPGTIEAKGWGSSIQFFGSKVDNWGSIAATLGGAVLFEYSLIGNARGAVIDADGRGSEVIVDHDLFANSGYVDAGQRGTVLFENSFVANAYHGTIEASGWGSEVKFEQSYITNLGAIQADHGGTVSIDRSIIDNWNGTIEATGCGATIDLDCAIIVGGTLETKWGGLIQTVSGTSTLDGVTIAFDSNIDVGRWTTLTLSGGTTMFGGTLAVEHGGSLDIEGRSGAVLAGVDVINNGNIEIDSPHDHAKLVLEDATKISGGELTIGDHSELAVESSKGATLDNVDVTNRGIIQVDDSGPATLYLTDGTAIHGGTLSIGYDGTVDIESGRGATLDDVSVWNNGTMTFGAAAEDSNLFIGGTVTLQGDGNLVLAGYNDDILGARGGGELVNDSNIVGYGNIGNGGESLKLVNGAGGTIDANHYHEALVVDTGDQAIDNDGLLAASYGGELLVKSTVDNFWGSIQADAGSKVDLEGLVLGGTAKIAGGTMILTAAFGLETAFANDTPDCTSTLVLKGTGLSFITDAINGFSHGDVIDLADIAFDACGPSETTFKLVGDLLTVNDGLHGPSVTIQLDGNYNADNIVLSKDANGDTEVTFDPAPAITGIETISDSSSATPSSHGSDKVSGTVDGSLSFNEPNTGDTFSASFSPDGKNYVGTFHVDSPSENGGNGSVEWSFDFNNVNLTSGQTLTQSYDVAVADEQGATATQQISVSVGGPGHDNFVFAPGIGADTIANFNPQADTIELDHFANVQNQQELAAAITSNAHGDAVIELGHNDSVTIPGMTANYLQAHLQSLVHLH
jgi:FecR protein